MDLKKKMINETLIITLGVVILGLWLHIKPNENRVYNDSGSKKINEESKSLSNVPDKDGWKTAYADYLKSITDEYKHTYSCALIHIDDNDIPEVFVSTGICANGEMVLSFYDGKVVVCCLPRLGSEYFERSGLIYTDTGHMGNYPITVTKLEDGKFIEVASGSYTEAEIYYGPDGKEIDSMDFLNWEKEGKPGEPYFEIEFIWEWMGKRVTEEEYNSLIEGVYDVGTGKYPATDEIYYPYDDFMEFLMH